MYTSHRNMIQTLLFIILNIGIVTSNKEQESHYKPCPEDYVLLGEMCYKIGDKSDFDCRLAIINSKEENDLLQGFLIDSGEDTLWIGRAIRGGYSNFERATYGGTCNILKRNGKWKADYYCEGNRKSICKVKRDCEMNWIGDNCELQCHCFMKNCTKFSPSCKYGCQPGWVGYTCSKEIPKPEVEHYCLKNRTHYTMMLTMDMKTNYKRLLPLDMHGFVLNPDKFNNDEKITGLNTLEITTKDLRSPFYPNYYAKKIHDDIGTNFLWSLRLSELENAVLPSDIDFRVQCNFSDADLTYSSVSLDYDSDPADDQLTLTPDPAHITIRMFMSETHKTKPVKNVTLGQPVKLVISQEVMDASVHSKPAYLSPRKCFARSRDGYFTRPLSDENGCSLASQIFREFRHKSSGLMVTRPFMAFSLPGYSSYEISCSLVACYSDDDSNCLRPCGRTRRSVMGEKEPVFMDISTNVHIN